MKNYCFTSNRSSEGFLINIIRLSVINEYKNTPFLSEKFVNDKMKRNIIQCSYKITLK